MLRFSLLMLLLAAYPLVASAQSLERGPALRVHAESWGFAPPPRVVHTVTPAMRVWILRGGGPAGARVLGELDVDTRTDDVDAAVDRLQERALGMHADAVVGVRIEHRSDHTIAVHGVAVRFA